MNIGENYRKLKKKWNKSIRLYLQKILIERISKLNNLGIKQHFNLGTSLESEYEI